MKEVEMIGGFTVYVPLREYALLKKIVDRNLKTIPRSSLTPRAATLADNLVQHHVLDRDDENYYVNQFKIKD